MVTTKALSADDLSDQQFEKTQEQLQRVRPRRGPARVFLAYVAFAQIRPQTGRPSVPGAVEVGGEERPHLELGSPA